MSVYFGQKLVTRYQLGMPRIDCLSVDVLVLK